MSRGLIVHWMLEEVGAEYETKILDWSKAEHKSPAYLKINPMGKIPSIVHKGVVITETAAICAYLADAFPHSKLAPRLDDPTRGTYLRALFFAASCVEPALIDRKYPRTGSPKASHLGYGTYQDTINTLEKFLAQGFILGDRFSAADVYISSLIHWSLMQNNLDSKPIYKLYVEKCMDRPAFHRVHKN